MIFGVNGRLNDDDYLQRRMHYERLLSQRSGTFIREVRPGVCAWRCVLGHTHYGELRLDTAADGQLRMTLINLPDEPGTTPVSEENEKRTTTLDLTLDERIEQLLKDL